MTPLSFSKQISSLSSSYHYDIRDLSHIRYTFDFTTASKIAISLVHSQLDYWYTLCHSFPVTKLKRFQQIQNWITRSVTSTPKHLHITPAFKSIHLRKVEHQIQYKIISITHNLIHKSQPASLCNLISIQPTGETRSSDHLCLSLLYFSSKQKFSDRFFPPLWNYLPINLISFLQLPPSFI